MRVRISRWSGPRGRRSEAFGWHHYYILRNVLISWKWSPVTAAVPAGDPGPFSRIRTWLWGRGWWPGSRRWIPMGLMEREVDE